MHNVTINPYLHFGGRCEEALEFYKKSLSAEVDFLMLYKQSPQPMPCDKYPAGWENKVMHSTFRVGHNVLMATDGMEQGTKFSGFTLSLTVKTDAEAAKVFAALSEGGQVHMPLQKTFWSSSFGVLADRFGVGWMVNVMQ